MLKILIVENNKEDLKECLKVLACYQKEMKIDMKCDVENDYTKVLEKADQYDIVFFDIELNNNVNGIDLAVQIRHRNKQLCIIFMSNFNKYLIDGYKAQANLYLLKPIQQSEFKKEMNRIVKEYHYHHLGIVDLRFSQTKIYFKDILYIEVLARKLIIHFINGKEVSCYDTLAKWKEILKDCPFSQPHRSFLVNMEHIILFEKYQLTMKDYTVIPITDKNQEHFKNEYVRYLNRSA